MKFASMDNEVVEVRQYLKKPDQNNKALFDQLVLDIKNTVTDIDSNFGHLDQSRRV